MSHPAIVALFITGIILLWATYKAICQYRQDKEYDEYARTHRCLLEVYKSTKLTGTALLYSLDGKGIIKYAYYNLRDGKKYMIFQAVRNGDDVYVQFKKSHYYIAYK